MTEVKVLFPIKVSEDNMTVVIPENTKLSLELSRLSYDEFCAYVAQAGFRLKPKLASFEKFQQLFLNSTPYVDEPFVVLQGRPFLPARDGIVKWLNDPAKRPLDLVEANVPFAILYPARGPLPAKDVFGREATPIATEAPEKPLTPFKLHPSLSVSSSGEITASTGGQAILKPNFLDFHPAYTITDVRSEVLQKFTFPCDVVVEGDLEGALEWTVHGNLTVKGFWASSHIKVLSDACAHTGIQTNFLRDLNNAIVIHGNLQANFIQNSTLHVGGKASIGAAVINSYLVVDGGDLDCNGEPGKIVGSDIVLKTGSLFAKNLGSENNTASFVNFHNPEAANQSKINFVAEGTRIQIKRSKMIMPSTQPWPIPKPTTK